MATAAASRSSNGSVGVDGGQRRLGRRGVEGGLDGGVDQRLLVGEDPEDGALGDAGGLGDLAGGDVDALGQQEGHGGGDDGGPSLVGRHRGGRVRAPTAGGASAAGVVGSDIAGPTLPE